MEQGRDKEEYGGGGEADPIINLNQEHSEVLCNLVSFLVSFKASTDLNVIRQNVAQGLQLVAAGPVGQVK